MIVLFSCFTNLLESKANDAIHPSTGVVDSNDSVLISYDDIRIANSKMIELKYEKEKNVLLKTALAVDSILLETKDEIINDMQKGRDKAIKQRNIAEIAGGASLLALLMVLIFK